MQNRIHTIAALLRTAAIAAGVLMAATPAHAQLQDTMKFTTAFPFVVSGKTLPAGTYTITPVAGDSSLMRVTNGHSSALMMTEGDSSKLRPHHDQVTFTKQDGAYVLREVWDSANQTGVEPIMKRAH